MKKSTNTGKVQEKVLPVAFLTFLILLAEILIRLLDVKAYILPRPSAVVARLIEDFDILLGHTLTTLYEALLGFTIAIVLAIVIAGLMNRYKMIKMLIYPLLVISQTIPIIALAPLFLIWFGFGITTKIVVVVIVCFFPIVVSLVEGLAVVDQDMINLMKSLKARPMDVFLKVEVPAVMPSFFSGLKIAATYSIMGAVIAEWLGAKSGLGIYMTRAMSSFKADALFADIVIVVAISIGIFKLIEFAGRRLMPWHKGE